MSSPAEGLPDAGRGGSGAARGWRQWWGQVFRETRRNWPVMLWPLLLRTAVPALPAAVCVFVINEAIGLGLSGGGGLQGYGAFLLLVLCVPLAVAGGYLVASGLARAVTGASIPGTPGRHMRSGARRAAPTPGEVRAGRLAGYVAGLAILLPAAVCVFEINAATEHSVPRTDDLPTFGAFLLLVLCVPLAVAGGNLVASRLGRAVAAATGPGIPARHLSSGAGRAAATPGEVRVGRLWAGYVAGLAVLMTISALAPVFISRATVTGHLTCAVIPGELNCATAPGFILCCVGPLGFLCPLMLLPATRLRTGGRSGFSPTASARLATAALAVVCYEIAVGYGCLRLIIIFPADSLFLPVTLAANLLAIPAMIFLVSAALVTNAEAETGLAGPAGADWGG